MRSLLSTVAERSHRLHRGAREIKRGAVIAIVGAAVAYGGYLIAAGGGAGRIVIGGLLLLIGGFAVLVGFNGMFFEQVAACPSCGSEVGASERTGALSRCIRCGTFLETRDGSVHQLPERFVAAEPRFYLHVPEQAIGSFRMPNLCCLCGAPSTRTDEQELRDSKTLENVFVSAVGSAVGVAVAGVVAVRTGGQAEYRVWMPYCAVCTDGATAKPALGGLDLKFRSLAYARSVSDANSLKLTL